jgi:hypothetical protein
MPWVGFETTIPASERAKIIQASDLSAIVTGWKHEYHNNNNKAGTVSHTNEEVGTKEIYIHVLPL